MASLNICAITSLTKIEMLRQFINRNKFDVVFLQEVSVPAFNFFGYKEQINNGPNNRGTAILYKDNIPLHTFRHTLDGRGISAKFGHHTLVNVYAPSGSQNRQARNIFYGQTVTPLFAATVDNVIMAGDHNSVARAADCTGAFHPCQALNRLVEGLHLADPTVAKGRPVVFTHRTRNSAARLDRFYVSDNLLTQVTSMHEHPCAFTDHVGVACHIKLGVSHAARGPSYWKLNQAILNDKQFLPQFSVQWAEWVKHKRRFNDIADWWENYAKVKIKYFCLRFTSEMYRDENTMVQHLQQCLTDLMREPTPSPTLQQQTHEIKAALVQHTERRLAGLTIRSKCVTPVADEKATMHHVVRRHKRARSRAIHSLRLPDGTTTNDNVAMRTHARQSLTDKFAAPMGPSIAAQYLEQQETLLNEQHRVALGSEITENELLAATKASPKAKSPGSDGIPPEFYAKTWEVIKDDLLLVIKCVLERGKLTPSQAKGVLVLIPKVTNAHTLDQFRALTLLNTDYKLIARILKNRVTEDMSTALLHPMQVGAGTQRDITASLCDIRDVISTHEQSKQAAALVSIDLKSAFDNVDHEYLFEILNRVGFGDQYTKWIKVMYTQAYSCVEINGYVSTPFPVKRSVRQGCPLAMLLFSVAKRPLVAELHRTLTGSPVRPNLPPFKVTNYVDDTQVVLIHEENQQDYKALKHALIRFSSASGLQVNWQKSKTLLLGKWDNPPQYEFSVVQQTRILGIQFSAQTLSLPALNWPAITNAAMAVLDASKYRQLTLEERVWYVGTYALSKLWYAAKVVAPLAKNLTRVRVLVSNFLWAGRVVKLPYPVMCLPKRKGGLGLHDALLRCKALFASRWWTISQVTPTAFSATCLEAWTVQFLQSDRARTPRSCDHLRVYNDIVKVLPCGMVGEGKANIGYCYTALREQSLKAEIRVEQKLPNTDWPQVWANIQARHMPLQARDTWFQLVHDIIPTNERLHRIHLSQTDRCTRCNRWDTALHRATACGNAADVWAWLRATLANLTGQPVTTFQQDFVVRPDQKLNSKNTHCTVMWLTGTTLAAVLGQEVAPTLEVVKQTIQLQRTQLQTERAAHTHKTYGNALRELQIV